MVKSCSTLIPSPRAGIFCIAALCVAGCSQETGILAAVSGLQVATIEFHVGVRQGAEFIRDQAASGMRVPMGTRDLSKAPYALLLREPAAALAPTEVRVLALGYSADGTLRGFALTEPPQPFITGEVVRRNLILAEASDSRQLHASGADCFSGVFINQNQRTPWSILAIVDDQDCDGVTSTGTPKDCDDQDYFVHPGAREVCDGKDTNCDGVYAPSTEVCYRHKDENDPTCVSGTRTCDDRNTSVGLGKTCELGAQPESAANVLCDGYERCAANRDPLGCLEHEVPRFEFGCTIADTGQNGACGGTFQLKAPNKDETVCQWEIDDDGGLGAQLGGKPTGGARSTKSCAPFLVLPAGTTSDGVVVIGARFGADPARYQLLRISVARAIATDCGPTPLSCVPK